MQMPFFQVHVSFPRVWCTLHTHSAWECHTFITCGQSVFTKTSLTKAEGARTAARRPIRAASTCENGTACNASRAARSRSYANHSSAEKTCFSAGMKKSRVAIATTRFFSGERETSLLKRLSSGNWMLFFSQEWIDDVGKRKERKKERREGAASKIDLRKMSQRHLPAFLPRLLLRPSPPPLSHGRSCRTWPLAVRARATAPRSSAREAKTHTLSDISGEKTSFSFPFFAVHPSPSHSHFHVGAPAVFLLAHTREIARFAHRPRRSLARPLSAQVESAPISVLFVAPLAVNCPPLWRVGT